MISAWTTMRTIEVFLSVVLIFQTMEFFALRRELMSDGLLPWQISRKDFQGLPKIFVGFFDFIFRDQVFLFLLGLRFIICILSWTSFDGVFAILPSMLQLAISLLIMWRWRGAFNGGSDFLTLIMLMVVCLSHLFSGQPVVVLGGLWYLALQVCLSYFVAGFVKVVRAEWRSGAALEGFLTTSVLSERVWLPLGRQSRLFLQVATWGVLFFELLFPLSLLNGKLSLLFMALGLLFHLVNFFIFGLNRFFWTWFAAYPALYYCSQI